MASASAPVVNIYDSNLVFVGSLSTPTPPTNLVTHAGTLYVTRGNSSVTTYNLSTPAAPTLIGSSAPASIQTVSGTRAYGVVSADGTTVPITSLRGYDVTAASRMAPVAVTNSPLLGTMVTATSGGRAVFTTGDANPTFNPPNTGRQLPLLAYDFTTPSQPKLVGQDNMILGAYAIASSGDYAYLATGISVQVYTLSGLPLATRTATPAALPFYPNPAHGILTLPQLAPATPVTIFNALGQVCLDSSLPASGLLDISTLPAGLYQVRAGHAASKLIVE
ncbi:MAG: T9SS type A sorting domain-containing protein [Hymenobacter sp.]|nr:MAG: T9SS type A sorting domain-containing protein [Hymenobacter sp.]